MHGRLQREHVQGYVCAAHAHAHQAGQELDAFLARHRERDYTRVVYVGDGANDFCPVEQLREQDVAFVRRHRGLAKRIHESGGVRCQVRYWGGAWEAEQLLGLLGAGA